jgi:hypothetical protein
LLLSSFDSALVDIRFNSFVIVMRTRNKEKTGFNLALLVPKSKGEGGPVGGGEGLKIFIGG